MLNKQDTTYDTFMVCSFTKKCQKDCDEKHSSTTIRQGGEKVEKIDLFE